VRDPFFKYIEIGFRRLLISSLNRVFHRLSPFPASFDYNHSKFLFIRQDKIGDVLISTPLFAILKRHYPSAILDAMLSKHNQLVLANDPNIRKRWIYTKNIKAVLDMVNGIRREQYDFVIDLMDNPSATSTILCLLSGARWTVGIEKENDYAYDIKVPMLSRRDTHILDRIVQLLVPFGIDPKQETIAVRYVTSGNSKIITDSYLSSNEAHGKELIGINISAGTDVRFWGIKNFRGLVQRILKQFPTCIPIILFAPAHQDRAVEISEDLDGCLVSPLTKSFDEFAAFVERCSFLITPDTSAVHLAAAFGIPSVVLYVQSNKELRIWEPYGTDYEALIADIDNLSVIPVEKVFAAFSALYKRVHH